VDVLALMQDCGIGALGIAAIVNGLVGAILGFVGAAQLRRFGAELYVTDLVGVGVVREMAPIMTAIVMAGRTGGAYAAQIATMQGSEEIDALRALGIPVSQFVVIPRILAAVTMVPILTLYGCFMGLFGGFVVGVVMLHLSPAIFLSHLRSAVPWTEFAIGLTKSVCFGAVIAIAGCRTGLDAGRSAADVGHAATSAVVDGIIGVIALDAIFAACAEVLGI
jgi:phospholipid/cholesterol/gamma-HCH transport system permease protein